MKQEIVLAAGCFWGVEEILRKLPGVLDTEVGYAGGEASTASYRLVCQGDTGHAEAVRVRFDSEVLPLSELLSVFFRLHDPTTPHRQGNDVGPQYRSMIFITQPGQKEIAQEVMAQFDREAFWPAPICTEVVEFNGFFPAEEEHQDYLQKNPGGYTCHFLRPPKAGSV